MSDAEETMLRSAGGRLRNSDQLLRASATIETPEPLRTTRILVIAAGPQGSA
jgi:hypothetical protein